MISGILLSAGLSSRFGSPKALARLNQETVLEHVQSILLDSPLAEIIVVLGPHAEAIKPLLRKHKKIKTVYNADYQLGQTSSFKKGLEAVSSAAQGVLLLPLDYPFLQKATLVHLAEFFLKEKPLILIPTHNGKKGHPPIFNISLKKEFLILDNASGVNEIIHRHPSKIHLLPVNDPGVLATFNTPEEFAKLKAEFFHP